MKCLSDGSFARQSVIHLFRFLFLSAVIILQLSCSAPQSDVYALTLETIDSGGFPLSRLQSDKVSVIVFLSPECPMCQSYSLTLNQLQEKYHDSGIGFYGVFPGTASTRDDIKAYGETYKIKFPLLTDEKKQLASALKAGVTPQVYVLNHTGEILYKGAIDNWLTEPGQKRAVITEHYLDDALKAVSANGQVKIKFTQAKGCLIE